MCGGLIHPIAGKCKHCKGDLTNQHGARPAASAALPSIIATGAAPLNPRANGHAPPNGHNGHNGHSNGSYAPMPQAAAPIAVGNYEASNPILPPRPTGRMQTAQTSRDWWKSWPLVVIVLAVLAIVTAVVLMVWPPGKPANADTGEPSKGNKIIPAPERMETNPLPPKPPRSSQVDPGTRRPGGAPIDIPDDPDDDVNPPRGGGGGGGGGTLPGGLGGGSPQLSGKNGVIMGLAHHLCDRAITCGQADPLLKAYCDQAKQFKVAPSNCNAANRCYAHIDQMSCTGDFDSKSITKLMTGVTECVEAVNGC